MRAFDIMNARAAMEKQSSSGDEEGGFLQYLKELWRKCIGCFRRGRAARFARFDVLADSDSRKSRVTVMP